MTKDAYWFPHDSNAHGDPRIKRLLRLAGWEGYGVYWALIEMLRSENAAGYRLPLTAIDDICFSMRFNRETVTAIFNSGLFSADENMFWSDSLINRMVHWDEKRRRRAEAGRRGGQAKARAMKNRSNATKKPSNATAMLQQCQSNATKKPSNAVAMLWHCSSKERTEQNITEQNRIEQNTSCAESVFTAPRSGREKNIADELQMRFGDRLRVLKPETVEKLIKNLSDPIFGGVDVPGQIARAAIWEDSNPTRRKTPRGLPKFLTGWIERCQNNGHRNGRSGSPIDAPHNETREEGARRRGREVLEAHGNGGKNE